jgi:hypothetical protein
MIQELIVPLLLFLAVAGPQRGGRLRPPDNIPCSRDHLTSFTGALTSYSRDAAQTTFAMRTDEQTSERFVVRHGQAKDPARWFLLWGNPFGAGDWKVIEEAAGRLRRNMRATVWVCEGGDNPIVDWQPPRTGD